MKRILLAIALLPLSFVAESKGYEVISPDGRLSFSVECASQSSWALSVDGVVLSEGNRLGLGLALPGGKTLVLGDKAGVKKVLKGQVRREVRTPLYRQKSVRDDYNWLTLKMKGGFDLELRAYDEGVAYRFVTHMKDSLTVKDEFVEFRSENVRKAYIPYHYGKVRDDVYESSFENQYELVAEGNPPRSDRFAFLPILAGTDKGSLLLTESDIEDYPGMFVSTGADVWKAVFPPIPSRFRYSKRYNVHRSDYKDMIARTVGTRTFPWRIIAYAERDEDLPVNDLTWLLGSPSRLDDISWIEPGLSSWDWWNGFKLLGVDFVSGINTATYLRHVDFASRFGLRYIILDEGWYKAPDLMNPIQQIDIKAICDYASSKGVKVVLWSTGALVDMVGIDKVFDYYASLGVAGFKLDFFDGQDALTVAQIHRLASKAAAHHLILDLHGMYKPAGLNRTWPNILGFEGVYGTENLSRKQLDLPEYDVTFPYIRQAGGPADYTPGVMRNAAINEKTLVARGGASQGTRAHQVALYVVLDQPFGVLCDSPSLYEKEPETTSFIASIPTVFDSTFIQSGTVGESIVSVREKDGRWYIGGLTDWNPRDMNVSFGFLPEGEWTARIYKDGCNAHKYGEDFTLSEQRVSRDSILPLHMAPGGGFAIILTRAPFASAGLD